MLADAALLQAFLRDCSLNLENLDVEVVGAIRALMGAVRSGREIEARTMPSIRVDVGLLDRVMNLVGELVLARNQILQIGGGKTDSAAFANAAQRLSLLTTELQEGVMKTRMQPIGSVWSTLPALVTDAAAGKKVDLSLEGAETELDRTLLEALSQPLFFAVRQAVDAIEASDARIARGKSETGSVSVRAFHEGGQVIVEISDDGGGADRARTAQAVRASIEKLGGTVDDSVRPGKGGVLVLKIPLTLAIIPALVVTCASDDETSRFAIPQVNLLELVRLEGEQAERAIERIHGTAVHRLRGNLLPLVFLDEALGLSRGQTQKEVVNIVVLQADEGQFGLVVDGILDTEEIVVKPLGKELKGIQAFAGATIMGDGRVALILDVLGIAHTAGLMAASRESVGKDNKASVSAEDAPETLLLFQVGSDGRMALPLSMVARLEEIPSANIERAGGREVVQYRGAILPLIALGRSSSKDEQPLQVIVYAENDRRVGFVVDRILDVVEERVTVRMPSNKDGVLGAAVVQGRITDLLDAHAIIQRSAPELFT